MAINPPPLWSYSMVLSSKLQRPPVKKPAWTAPFLLGFSPVFSPQCPSHSKQYAPTRCTGCRRSNQPSSRTELPRCFASRTCLSIVLTTIAVKRQKSAMRSHCLSFLETRRTHQQYMQLAMGNSRLLPIMSSFALETIHYYCIGHPVLGFFMNPHLRNGGSTQ